MYEIHVDNDGDAKEDLTFQFRFKNRLGDNNTRPDAADRADRENVAVPLKNIGPVSAQDVSKSQLQRELHADAGARRSPHAASPRR